jgi:myo-inositol-1(or 4)-monophosphatase
VKDFLKSIITRAGEISLDYRSRLASLEVRKKSRNDLVSEADIAVERYLIEQIRKRFGDHAIHGEESGDIAGSEYRWIIDPIDGTTSFIHGQPYYSVSIALEKAGEVILAAVNAPVLGELYEAQLGKGATLNGEMITVSQTSAVGDSVMATGFACLRFDKKLNNLPFFSELVPRLRDVRRYGSAAIDLCYTACGRLEGFWELNLQVHDVAAGFLILSEAGGKYSDFAGAQDKLYREVLGTNGGIHDEICRLFSAVKSQIQG